MHGVCRIRPPRALYGSKKETESRKRYSDEVGHNDVESRMSLKLAEFAQRRKKGHFCATHEETEYILSAAPFLYEHNICDSRDAQRDVYKAYLSKVEGLYDEVNSKQPIPCYACNKGEMLHLNDGDFVCGECHNIEPGPSTYCKADFENNPPPRPPRQQMYKPINHFNEMLVHFQGKEMTEIPLDVIEYVKTATVVHFPMETITHNHVKKLLRLKKLNKYYRNIPSIVQRALGHTPPCFNDDQTKSLRHLFVETQNVFAETCVTRINFLSINFLLYKFCELMTWHSYLPLIPLLKSPEKLAEHDKAWQEICVKTGWVFIQTNSVPRCLTTC